MKKFGESKEAALNPSRTDSVSSPQTDYTVIRMPSTSLRDFRFSPEVIKQHPQQSLDSVVAGAERFLKDTSEESSFDVRVHILGTNYWGSREGVERAVKYAKDNNVLIASGSLGAKGNFQQEQQNMKQVLYNNGKVFADRAGIVYLQAAGNDGSTYKLRGKSKNHYFVGTKGYPDSTILEGRDENDVIQYTHAPQGPARKQKRGQIKNLEYTGTSYAAPHLNGALLGAVAKSIEQKKIVSSNGLLKILLKDAARVFHQQHNLQSFDRKNSLTHEDFYNSIDKIADQVTMTYQQKHKEEPFIAGYAIREGREL